MTTSRKRRRIVEPTDRKSLPENVDELPKHFLPNGEVGVEEFMALLELLNRKPRRLDWFRQAELNLLVEKKSKRLPADPS